MPKININGITREMTPEEVAEYERLLSALPQPEPSEGERIAALERDNAQLKEALELLLSGATEEVKEE